MDDDLEECTEPDLGAVVDLHQHICFICVGVEGNSRQHNHRAHI